jgi:hypothetical protein
LPENSLLLRVLRKTKNDFYYLSPVQSIFFIDLLFKFVCPLLLVQFLFIHFTFISIAPEAKAEEFLAPIKLYLTLPNFLHYFYLWHLISTSGRSKTAAAVRAWQETDYNLRLLQYTVYNLYI